MGDAAERQHVGWVVSADATNTVDPPIDSVNVWMAMRKPTSRHRPNVLRRGDAARSLGRRGPVTAAAIGGRVARSTLTRSVSGIWARLTQPNLLN